MPRRQVFVVILTTPHGDKFDIVGAYDTYEAAQSAARSLGVDKCLVRATDFHQQ